MSFMVNGDDGCLVIYAKSKICFSSKESSLPKVQKQSSLVKIRASAKAKRTVIFPIFDKMMELETDSYWKSLFDEAATGKFPRNFKFQNGILNYKIRSKTIEQILDPDNIEESIQTVKRFFLDTAGILSPDDLIRKKQEEEKRISELIMNEVISWNQIRSEKQRMIMISLYVETIGKEYGLTVEERKGLVQNIRIGMLAGYFNSDNIKIIGNRIDTIEGLEYNQDTKEFEINKELCKAPKINRKTTPDYTETVDDTMEHTVSSDTEMGSLQSSQSLKKRWNKFLSDTSKK